MSDAMVSAAQRDVPPQYCDVIVIGAGPAGLSTATALRESGVGSVVVLDRESQAGGIPRHCGNPPFGMREFKRILTGPQYAAYLTKRAREKGVEIYLNCSVIALHSQGQLTISTVLGAMQISAKRVVICTGVRETPRSTRLVSGQRPLGISTTGALQSMVYLKGKRPFKRPIIVGTELVAFSALLTCRKANIKPVAMIEQAGKTSAYGVCDLLPRIMGVKLYKNCQLLSIEGSQRVSAVNIMTADGSTRRIDCDGVLFSGQFTAEASLIRMSHLAFDEQTGLPVVDQFGQCSDAHYYAVGNLLHPVETAGWCWQEGQIAAANISQSLLEPSKCERKEQQGIALTLCSDKVSYITPQRFSNVDLANLSGSFQLRFVKAAKGILSVQQGGAVLWSKKDNYLPHRRILIPFQSIENKVGFESNQALEIHFTEQ